MKRKQLLQKACSWILSATLAVSVLSGIPAPDAAAADGSARAVENWKTEMYIDFGTGTNIVSGSDADLATNYKFSEDPYGYTCNEPVIAGYGTWLYDSEDVGALYGGASNGQKIGFDRKLPAGVVTTDSPGEYFRDFVFSPDGENFTFSVDLPAGQYYLYVYTGNKTRNYHNTTKVSLSDNGYQTTYDQKSDGGGQCKAPNCVYTVTVTEKNAGCGYGTLGVKLFDDTIMRKEDGSYADSYTDANTVFFGTDVNGNYISNDNAEATTGKIVTARLNGIEIMPVPNPVKASKLTSEDTEVTVGINETRNLSPAVSEPAGTTERIEYYSENPAIATVDQKTGTVTGIARGTTKIIAATPSLVKDETKCAVYNVTVMKSVKSVGFYDAAGSRVTSYTMTAGNTLTVSAKTTPEDADNAKVTYSFAQDTDLATIDPETGVITAKQSGTVNVRATSESNSSIYALATLTINPAFSIKYHTESITLNAEKTIQNELSFIMAEEIENESLLNKNITYSSSDESIATVSEDGTVKALKAGTATITATAEDGGQTASYTVIVKQPAASIKVAKTSITLNLSDKKKKTAKIGASLVPGDSTDSITYKPKNPKIVKVDKTGKVTALKPGKTTITVKSTSGKKKTITVKVTAPATKLTLKNGKKNLKNGTKIALRKGRKITLKASVSPKNSTDKVTWVLGKSKGKKKVVTLKNGVVTAKAKGTVSVTAKAGKKKVTVKITVK